MTDVHSALSGAFADPSIDSARAFRALLKAMSRPGLVVPIAAELAPPPPLSVECAVMILTLADADTPIWLAPELAEHDVRRWLAFHTGAPIVPDPGKAMFAVARKASAADYARSLAIGTAEFPDRAATLVLDLPDLGGNEAPLGLTGPGIESETRLDGAALPAEIVSLIRRNADLYPLGVDVVLTAPGAIVGVPRSTRLADKEPR